MGTTRSARRAVATVVVLLHGAVGVTLQQSAPPGDRGPPRPVAERPPLIVRLMAPPLVPAEPRREAPPPARPRTPVPAAPVPAVTSITPGTPPSAEVPIVDVPAATGPTAPAQLAIEPPPLRLSLPRAASAPPRHPALDDPRSRTPPTTLESRIAAATGMAAPTEELRGDGRARYRRGLQCADVEPSRAGELDPFNAAVSPKPKAAKPC